jgi:hypothetical protein
MIFCVFTCPMTGQTVRTTAPDDLIGPDTMIAPLECPLCRRPHLVRVDDIEREDRPKDTDAD